MTQIQPKIQTPNLCSCTVVIQNQVITLLLSVMLNFFFYYLTLKVTVYIETKVQWLTDNTNCITQFFKANTIVLIIKYCTFL